MDSIDFKKLLKERGYKLTPQRQAVLDIIIKHDGEHLAQKKFMILLKKQPEIGLATVYRTLLLLDDMGLVDKLNLDDGLTRYELNNQKKTTVTTILFV